MKEVLDRLDSIDALLTRIDGRLDGIDGRLDGIDGRLDGIDRRFDGVDTRFDGVDRRFDGVDLQLQKQGVLLESVSADLKQTMEAVIGNRQVMDQEFAKLRRQIDERVQPIEWASRHFSKQLAARGALKRRRKRRA